ncbi:MAG TPA: hypothetical protein VLL77_08000 [Anaerolineales bacterium]|nr:hypothetical protein [Anaerolineales bacterium]
MYYLAAVVPFLRRRRIPVSRDEVMLLMAALNEFFLAVDILLAHSISGTITRNEWIPIVFGPLAAIGLVVAGLVARRQRDVASVVATSIFLLSILVGLLGAYFHLVRAILPYAPIGERVSIPLLVWAPPILGPLTFALVGWLGLSAVWIETPPDSGRLTLVGRRSLRLPYSKTRAYLLIVGLGILATVISSVLDHARTDFSNPWLWVPTIVGAFAVGVPIGLAFLDEPKPREIAVHVCTMGALILVGIAGSWLHIQENLSSGGSVVAERFVRGAPFMAPLLFANMGTLGLIALLDPAEPVPGD